MEAHLERQRQKKQFAHICTYKYREREKKPPLLFKNNVVFITQIERMNNRIDEFQTKFFCVCGFFV